jgi:glycoside hydrolase-like protein
MSRHRLGIDYAWGGPIVIPALQRAGITFVGRYLSLDPSKNIHKAEYEQLRAHDIDVVLVWETTAQRALAGEYAGLEDARKAAAQCADCGMSDQQPIHFAVDFDAVGPEIEEYFRGVHHVLRERAGAYAGYRAIKWLFDHELIGHGWQTYAWSAGQWDPRALTRQYSNGHQLAGVEVDYDIQLLPQAAYVPADEHNWIREYDRLLREHRAPWRRGWLRHTMTKRRKLIWRLAQHTGWDTLNRVERYRQLLLRTE